MGRIVDWLLYRNRPTMTGIYDLGRIFPHQIHPPVVVCARIASRLQSADRVEFVAVDRADRPSEARACACLSKTALRSPHSIKNYKPKLRLSLQSWATLC
jgi:hypothetical protein